MSQYFTGPKAYRYWMCTRRYCKGRLNMNQFGEFVEKGQHFHENGQDTDHEASFHLEHLEEEFLDQ